MKIEILKGSAKKWYWRIKANNGRILAHSETYSSRSKAKRGAWSLVNAARVGKLGRQLIKGM